MSYHDELLVRFHSEKYLRSNAITYACYNFLLQSLTITCDIYECVFAFLEYSICGNNRYIFVF